MANKKADQVLDKEIVRTVAKSAGWMGFKAKKKLTEAQELGITPNQYLKYECWNMSEEELAECASKLEARRKLHHDRVTQLVEIGGLSRKYASDKIRAAKRAGISFKQLVDRRGYDLDDEDLPRLAKALKAIKRRRSDQRAYILDLLTQRSGWTRKNMSEHLKTASEKGINTFNYFVNACWTMDENQMDDLAQMYIDRRGELPDKREECIEYISACTGWSRGRIELEILETTSSCGCSYEDFARCHMWDMTLDQREEFMSGDLFRRLRFDNNDFVVGSPIFDYKDVFEDTFSDLIRRRHFRFEDMGKGEFFDRIKGLENIVVKPVRGSYGRNIEILPCNKSYLENGELYKYLADIGKPLVIEEKIEQCDALNDLCPTSVNTLRIVTLRKDGETHVLQCVLRVGVGAVVDNIHSGGLVVEVDQNSGECKGDAVDYFGNIVSEHPITKATFKGTVIPHIDSAIDLVTKASQIVPECGFIGWDVAITPDGAELVEGNLKADYDAGQMAHLGVKWEGLRKEVLEPYVLPSLVRHSYLKDLEKEERDAEGDEKAPFKFSVVMPIYNVEPYLEEAIESVVTQSIGFEENVQLILVNDGSTDGCQQICHKYVELYPENVIYVEQENAGVSSARNAGLAKAGGAWVNFFDSDDKWNQDAFEKVWKFIEDHPGEMDVIGCRQKYFEGRSGYHGLDYKFKEDRVVSIMTHPDCIQMSVTSAFIARRVLDDIEFDERLSIGEDSKLLAQVILDKERLGLLRSAEYGVRKRREIGSATQSKTSNKSAYTLTIDYYYDFIRDLSIKKYGRIIPYVQWCLTSGLKYRVIRPLPDCLSENEKDAYKQKVIGLISQIDDGVLLSAKHMTPSSRVYFLHLKHDRPFIGCAAIKDNEVWANNGRAFSYTGKNDVVISRIDIDEEKLLFEGHVRVPGFVDSCVTKLHLADEAMPINVHEEEKQDRLSFTGEVIDSIAPFDIDVELPEGDIEMCFETKYDGSKMKNILVFDAKSCSLGKVGSSFAIANKTVAVKDERTLSLQ